MIPPNTKRVPRRPAPSPRSLEAASDIQLAYRLGLPNSVLIADLIDYSTRCPQLDAVATAAAELLASLPVDAGGQVHCPVKSRRRTCVQQPVLKLARALQSLAEEDMDINPRALTTIKRLTSSSLAA